MRNWLISQWVGVVFFGFFRKNTYFLNTETINTVNYYHY